METMTLGTQLSTTKNPRYMYVVRVKLLLIYSTWSDLVHNIIYVTQIIKRCETAFGARNFKVTIGEVDFIAIDAQTLNGNSLRHTFDQLLAQQY